MEKGKEARGDGAGREVQLLFLSRVGFLFSFFQQKTRTEGREPQQKVFKGTRVTYVPHLNVQMNPRLSTQILHITGSTIPDFISVFLHVHTGLNKKISFVTTCKM